MPFLDAPEVPRPPLVINDKGHDTMAQAFFEHNQSANAAVAIFEGKDPGILRAYESFRCDRGSEPHPLRQLHPGSCDGASDSEVHPEAP